MKGAEVPRGLLHLHCQTGGGQFQTSVMPVPMPGQFLPTEQCSLTYQGHTSKQAVSPPAHCVSIHSVILRSKGSRWTPFVCLRVFSTMWCQVRALPGLGKGGIMCRSIITRYRKRSWSTKEAFVSQSPPPVLASVTQAPCQRDAWV